MNNSDMPAMPVPLNPGSSFQGHGPADGLTKREYFAGLAMQASVIRGYWGERKQDKAREAIEEADALLAELEKTK